MINLLSTTRKAEIRAARVNVFLTRYIGILLLAIAFIAGALYFSYTILQQTEVSAKDRIAANAEQTVIYKDTQDQVSALSSRLTEANSIMAQQKSYAKILTQLGQAMPQGTILSELTIDDKLLSGTPTEIVAYAKTDAEAVAIQQSLQNSGLFTQVSPKGTSPTEGIAGYPIKVTLTITINQGALR